MRKRGLYLHVVSEIATIILSGEKKPGDLLAKEYQLCQDFDVSRTVIRDALRVLASKGLIVARPRRGTMVREIEHWNYLDPEMILWAQALGNRTGFTSVLLEARHTIEPQVAALAAINARPGDIRKLEAAYSVMCEATKDNLNDVAKFNEGDKAFHLAILDATHNIILKQFGTLIVAALTIHFEQALVHETISLESLQHHGDVLEAIRNGDARGASTGIMAASQILNSRLNVRTHQYDPPITRKAVDAEGTQ